MPKRAIRIEDRVVDAAADWLTENEVAVSMIVVYQSDKKILVVDIDVQPP